MKMFCGGLFLIIFSCLILQAHAGIFNCYSDRHLLPPDTVAPPPPPGGASPLSGPSSACVGDISTYIIDVPVACSCQWTLNGTPLAETGSTLEITWTAAGNQEVSVVFFCSGGQSEPETITVTVYGIPQPGPITGNEPVCEYTYHTYSTTVGPGDSCQWTVNGVIQPGFEPTITYSFGSAGNYHFEVFAFNPCGTSNPSIKDVLVLYQPAVFLGNDTTIIQGQTLILDAGNPGSEYLWSTGETTQIITVISTGSYSVDVSNFCGSDADTIEVSVIVGIDEFNGPNDCFIISTFKRKIILTGFPESIDKIQVSSITGNLVYDGRPKGEVTVNIPGIYIIYGISGDLTCFKKVFVP